MRRQSWRWVGPDCLGYGSGTVFSGFKNLIHMYDGQNYPLRFVLIGREIESRQCIYVQFGSKKATKILVQFKFSSGFR
jgi:hypothetical protein